MNYRIYIILFFSIFYCSCLDKVIYYPDNKVAIRGNIPFPIEDVYIKVNDEVTLHGWFVLNHNAEFTLIYFHGNAGNITNRVEKINILYQIPLSVFIIDYRGFGDSSGKPSEGGLYADTLASYDFVINNKQLSPDSIIIYGESLGGAVAAYCATKRNTAGVILDSAFTDIYSMVKHHSAGFMYIFFSEKYPTIDYMQSIRCPVLILHSKDDEVAPFAMGQALYNASSSKHKQFVPLHGSHNANFIVDKATYVNSIQSFIQSLKTPSKEYGQ